LLADAAVHHGTGLTEAKFPCFCRAPLDSAGPVKRTNVHAGTDDNDDRGIRGTAARHWRHWWQATGRDRGGTESAPNDPA